MTTVSTVSMGSVPEARVHDRSLKTVVLFCCVGMIASLCLMAFDIDLSAGWV
jgi:hypothetical protein